MCYIMANINFNGTNLFLKKEIKGAAALEQQHSDLTSGHISGLRKCHLVGRGLLH